MRPGAVSAAQVLNLVPKPVKEVEGAAPPPALRERQPQTDGLEGPRKEAALPYMLPALKSSGNGREGDGSTLEP